MTPLAFSFVCCACPRCGALVPEPAAIEITGPAHPRPGSVVLELRRHGACLERFALMRGQVRLPRGTVLSGPEFADEPAPVVAGERPSEQAARCNDCHERLSECVCPQTPVTPEPFSDGVLRILAAGPLHGVQIGERLSVSPADARAPELADTLRDLLLHGQIAGGSNGVFRLPEHRTPAAAAPAVREATEEDEDEELPTALQDHCDDCGERESECLCEEDPPAADPVPASAAKPPTGRLPANEAMVLHAISGLPSPVTAKSVAVGLGIGLGLVQRRVTSLRHRGLVSSGDRVGCAPSLELTDAGRAFCRAGALPQKAEPPAPVAVSAPAAAPAPVPVTASVPEAPNETLPAPASGALQITPGQLAHHARRGCRACLGTGQAKDAAFQAGWRACTCALPTLRAKFGEIAGAGGRFWRRA